MRLQGFGLVTDVIRHRIALTPSFRGQRSLDSSVDRAQSRRMKPKTGGQYRRRDLRGGSEIPEPGNRDTSRSVSTESRGTVLRRARSRWLLPRPGGRPIVPSFCPDDVRGRGVFLLISLVRNRPGSSLQGKDYRSVLRAERKSLNRPAYNIRDRVQTKDKRRASWHSRTCMILR